MEGFKFLVLLSACFIWNCRALPAANQVVLLSKQSGRYVHVSEGGVIDAYSNKNSATVFIMYPINMTVQFEVKNKPGMFLMLENINKSSDADYDDIVSSPALLNTTEDRDDIEYALVVGNATETSLTRWETAGGANILAQRVPDMDTSCYIAFDSRGNVVGPCHLNPASDPECVVTIEISKPT